MKIHFLATALLATVASLGGVVSAHELRGTFVESEDLEEFDYDSEDPEDMIFNYSGYECDVYDRRIRSQSKLNNCCEDEFYNCKDDKHDPRVRRSDVPNCARQRQQCMNQRVRLAQVA